MITFSEDFFTFIKPEIEKQIAKQKILGSVECQQTITQPNKQTQHDTGTPAYTHTGNPTTPTRQDTNETTPGKHSTA